MLKIPIVTNFRSSFHQFLGPALHATLRFFFTWRVTLVTHLLQHLLSQWFHLCNRTEFGDGNLRCVLHLSRGLNTLTVKVSELLGFI